MLNLKNVHVTWSLHLDVALGTYVKFKITFPSHMVGGRALQLLRHSSLCILHG